eukprot:5571764-Alexandrium_andersonii.AAC.1
MSCLADGGCVDSVVVGSGPSQTQVRAGHYQQVAEDFPTEGEARRQFATAKIPGNLMGDCRFQALIAMLLKRQGARAGQSGRATCRQGLWASRC